MDASIVPFDVQNDVKKTKPKGMNTYGGMIMNTHTDMPQRHGDDDR